MEIQLPLKTHQPASLIFATPLFRALPPDHHLHWKAIALCSSTPIKNQALQDNVKELLHRKLQHAGGCGRVGFPGQELTFLLWNLVQSPVSR